MCCFISLFLVVSASAVNCLERLIFEMSYYAIDWGIKPYTFTRSVLLKVGIIPAALKMVTYMTAAAFH